MQHSITLEGDVKVMSLEISDGSEVCLLTYVVETNPVGGVHFFLNVPENNEAAMTKSKLVCRCCEWGAAIWGDQVCVAVGPLESHTGWFWLTPWWHGRRGRWGARSGATHWALHWQPTKVFRPNCVGPSLWDALPHNQEVLSGAAICCWWCCWWRRRNGRGGGGSCHCHCVSWVSRNRWWVVVLRKMMTIVMVVMMKVVR